MFRTIKAACHLIFSVLFHGGKRRALAKLPSPERETQTLYFLQGKIRNLLNDVGARVVYHGLENIPEDRNVFFAANHQSDFDPMLIYNVMDRGTGFVAKKEVEKIPIGAAWMRNLGGLFMDREDIRQSLQIIKEAAQKLSSGVNMMIFPEGTRSKGPEAGEFKRGALKPAFLSGTPILPIFIDGSYRLFEGNKKKRFTPAQVDVYFGHPVETAQMSRPEQAAFAAQMKEWILSQKEEIG